MEPAGFPSSSKPRSGDASFQGWLAPGFFILVLALIWFGTLGTRSLVTPDEGRYASLALGMAQSGDWVTPRLNGLLYFEKPALQYWIGALSFIVFGVTEFAARLWPGLAGFLTVLITGFTASRLWGRTAGIQALAITASMTWIVGNSHFLTLDAGLTLFLTLALCAVLLAAHSGSSARASRHWTWVAWAAMAGAVLSKGLVGIVIPGAVLVLMCIWQRDLVWWRRMHWASGLLIFFAIAAPWFVIVSMRNPGFAEFFFIHEHFARYLTKVHQREGAWWYYVPLLLGGLLPWTSALGWLARSPRASLPSAESTSQRRLLILWSAFVFLFFSLSGSKLPSYILPMFPALALLTAAQLRHTEAKTLKWHLLVPVLAWTLALVAATQVHRFIGPTTPDTALRPLAHALRAGAVIFFVGAAVAWWNLGRGRVTIAVLAVALAHIAATLLVMQSHNGFGQLKSAAGLVAVLEPLITPQTPVFAVRAYDQTLPFYLRRHVVLVDYEDEFALGEKAEPDRFVPTLDAFIARWQAEPRGAAYMNFETWFELNQRGVPMRVVFTDMRRVVVTKP